MIIKKSLDIKLVTENVLKSFYCFIVLIVSVVFLSYLSTWNCALNKDPCHLALICSACCRVGFPAMDINIIIVLPFFAIFSSAIGSLFAIVGSNATLGPGLRGSLSSYLSSSSISLSFSY